MIDMAYDLIKKGIVQDKISPKKKWKYKKLLKICKKILKFIRTKWKINIKEILEE
jgi:hypothetical protein